MDFWLSFILDIVKWWIILIIFAAFMGAQLRRAIYIFMGQDPADPGQQKMPSLSQGFGMILGNAAPSFGKAIGSMAEAYADKWKKGKGKE